MSRLLSQLQAKMPATLQGAIRLALQAPENSAWTIQRILLRSKKF
jgi:hypothetical protein